MFWVCGICILFFDPGLISSIGRLVLFLVGVTIRSSSSLSSLEIEKASHISLILCLDSNVAGCVCDVDSNSASLYGNIKITKLR